jgi:hypothetical protein
MSFRIAYVLTADARFRYSELGLGVASKWIRQQQTGVHRVEGAA